jgi:hypothetical protein
LAMLFGLAMHKKLVFQPKPPFQAHMSAERGDAKVAPAEGRSLIAICFYLSKR